MDFTTEPELPDPTPLIPPRVPAPFPVEALPGWVRRWVEHESIATQTPPDLAGLCVLGVLSACAGGRAVVRARPGWEEPVNLYLLPTMPPGSRKSAVVSAATAPLYEAEKGLIERMSAEITEARMLREIADKRAAAAAQQAARGKGDPDALASDAISAASQAEALQVPVVPRLIADDVTPEAMGSLLAQHGGRLAIISAEGGIFEVMAGRYSNGVPSLDVWLKGHAGDPLRVDRKGRPSEYVERPALTMLLTVQPVVLSEIARNGAFRGRGLLARYLYAIPEDTVGRRLIGAPPVPDDVSNEYGKRVRELVEELVGWTDPARLTLTPQAHELLLDLERRVEPKLARDGEYGTVREWASKLVGAMLRIAGLLHLADGPESFRAPISASTLAAAAALGEYFAEHAQAAFARLVDDGTSDAAYLLNHLHTRAVERFTLRDLLTALPRGRFPSAADVESTVSVLAEHGWVIDLPTPQRAGRGRPPSPAYRVHPSLLGEGVEVAAESADYAELAGARPSEQETPGQSTHGAVGVPPAAPYAEFEPDSAELPHGFGPPAVGPAHCIVCGGELVPGAAACKPCFVAHRVDERGRRLA